MTKRKIAESLLINQEQQHVMDGNINHFASLKSISEIVVIFSMKIDLRR